MKVLVALFTVALLATASTAAEAKHRHHHYSAHHKVQKRFAAPAYRASPELTCNNDGRCFSTLAYDANANEARQVVPGRAGYYYDGRVTGGRHTGDPHAFCGAEASRYVFGETKRDLWLAANWIAKFARTSPAPGMAAARRGHVMILISHAGGSDWLVHDGNSGSHLTREHVRSIAGYIIVDPHSPRMAAR